MKTEEQGRAFAPTRVLEMLEWRFGAFEAIADAVLGASKFTPDMCPPMDASTAWAIAEFADDLKQASEAAAAWMEQERNEIQVLRAALRMFNDQSQAEGLDSPPEEETDVGSATRERAGVESPPSELQQAESGERLPGTGERPALDAESLMTRRQLGDYEPEGSDLRSGGSVSVSKDSWWSATLSVPISGGGGAVFVHFQRHGNLPQDYLGDEEAGFFLPEAEIDAVLTLLNGIVVQARSQGVLRNRSDGLSDRVYDGAGKLL